MKRERSRAHHLIRRQARLQRSSHDDTGNIDIPEVAAATSGRFTSFLVADILGIGSYGATSGDVELMTSSDRHHHRQQQQKSDDFSVERLIQSNDVSKNTTSSMSTNVRLLADRIACCM